MRSIGRMICASVFLLSISPSAVRAQGVGASGDIRGTVTDSSGAAASQAKVTAVHVEKDRKSTRLNSSHGSISYAVFCLKKKKQPTTQHNRLHPQPRS